MSFDRLSNYASHYDESARLTILRALADQVDLRLNDEVLTQVMRTFGVSKGRDYTRNQLHFLEQEAGAVILTEIGSVIVAELTEAGQDHVDRRRILSGVKRPSPQRG